MTTSGRRLEALWPLVSDRLPGPRLSVLEVGCGAAGGFVPFLLHAGHQAVGVDPEAPEGPEFRRTEIEAYEPTAPVDVVVASSSLHHVHDLGRGLDAVTAVLRPGGTLVVLEWASERFDLATAQWCFDRMPAPGPGDEPGWLQHHRDHWLESGLPWGEFATTWREGEGLHSGTDLLRELDLRFDTRVCTHGPYFHPDLAATTAADEQTAIDAGEIQASGLTYVALRP